MIKYFCDVCGAETAGGDNTPSSWAAELCGLADLCPRCEGLVKKLDVSALVLAELRRMVAEQEAPSPSANPPGPKGKAARENRALYSIAYAKTVCLQSNEPLALEELRKIDGEPVWYTFPGADTLPSAGGFFCLCCKGEIIGPSGNKFDCERLDGRFYRHRPEEGAV